MTGFSLDQLARCAEREVQQRHRVYPRLIVSGKMRQEQAAREIAMMQEIACRLRAEAEANPQDNGRLL